MRVRTPNLRPAARLAVLLALCLLASGCSSAPRAGAGESPARVSTVGSAQPSPERTSTTAASPTDVVDAAPSASLSAQVAEPTADVQRPGDWAEPLSKPGLPNLHRVTAELYRGAQPTAEGMRQLPALGVRTVLNLRALHSDGPLITGLPLRNEHISMKAWRAEDEDIVQFLKIVTEPQNQPVFVHCQHGADRTGLAVAVYRVAVQGWTKEAAIREMTQGGYGFHAAWQNLIDYLQQLDVPRIRRAAGLE